MRRPGSARPGDAAQAKPHAARLPARPTCWIRSVMSTSVSISESMHPNAHLRHSAEAFPEISVHPDLWLTVRPASSMAAHLFVKSVQLDEAGDGCAPGSADETLRALRRAFFEEARDISTWPVQCDVAAAAGVDPARVEALIHDGRAFAALAGDYQEAEALRIQGSPTYLLNGGRQKLFGNVGFRIIEANIQELLRRPQPDQASWC